MKLNKLPDVFTFQTFGEGELYQMTNTGDGQHFCIEVGDDADDGRAWGDADILGHLNSGTWTLVKDLSVNDLSEPKLVFPFTFVHHLTPKGSVYYASEVDGQVEVRWEDREYASHFTIEQASEFIKNGKWIIKSVGEQKPVEAPTSNKEESMVLTAEVDTKDALEKIKELLDAVVELEYAYVSLKNTMRGGL